MKILNCKMYTLIIVSSFKNIAEEPVQFLKPLKDIKIMEKEKAVMECEINKPNKKAVWKFEKEIFSGSERVELVVDGCVHRMIIEPSELDDEGEYTIVVDGVKSSAILTVDGKLFIFILFLLPNLSQS